MSKFKKGDDVECVIEVNGSTTEGKIYKVVSVDDEGFLEIVEDDGEINGYSDRRFKLAERNPMPELEAGMVVKYLIHGREILCVYINEEVHYAVDGTSWGDGFRTGEILSVYSVHKRPLEDAKNYLGEPIWQRSDNSAELEQLAELKKTISDASDTIADAQKQASILEDALNGRR